MPGGLEARRPVSRAAPRQVLPFMSRNEAPQQPARKRRLWLTCRGARLQDGGKQRGDDGEHPPRAPAPRGFPARSGGREGEAAAGRQSQGAGGAGRGSYLCVMVQPPDPSST